VWATIRGREPASRGRCGRGGSGRPLVRRRTYAADGKPDANRDHPADDENGVRPGQRFCSHQRHWDQSVRAGRPSSDTGEYACRIRRLCPWPPRQIGLCGSGIRRFKSSHDGVVSQTRWARDDPRELQGWRGAVGRRHRRPRSHLFRDAVGSDVAGEERSIRLLAVSSEKRVPQIADVPTFAESGFPGFKALTWNGLMAPAATPRDTIDRIAKEVSRAAKDAAFAERLAAFGVDPLGNTPEEFAAMIAADIA